MNMTPEQQAIRVATILLAPKQTRGRFPEGVWGNAIHTLKIAADPTVPEKHRHAAIEHMVSDFPGLW